MEQSITFAGLLLCISLASAQLTYHLDANTNSYTLQTPNSQQTFTQHFNNAPNRAANPGAAVNQIQTAQSQPQPQLFSTSPQQFASNQNNGQEDISNYYRQQLELQQQQQRQVEPQGNNLYTTYQVSPQQRQAQQQPQQIQRQSSEGLDTYYQQIQQAQLLAQQQQQQQQLQQQLQLQQQQQQQQHQQYQQEPQYAQPGPQQFAYQQGSAGLDDNTVNQEAARFAQSQQLKYQQQQQQAPGNPSRVQFSPASDVSHVKFSSNLASYNF